MTETARQHSSSIRDRLTGRAMLFGVMQIYPNPVFSEMAAQAGYDFVILDCEHGFFDDRAILDALRAIAPSGMSAFVRLAGHGTAALGRALDMGAQGVIVPAVETAAQAQALVRAARFPPDGTRGYAASSQRATGYGFDLSEAPPRPCLAALIETRSGIDNIDEIVAVDGIDALFIGPSDLSASLGASGDFRAESYRDALRRVETAARDRGQLLGTPVHAGCPIEMLSPRGYHIAVIGSDVSLARMALARELHGAREFASLDAPAEAQDRRP